MTAFISFRFLPGDDLNCRPGGSLLVLAGDRPLLLEVAPQAVPGADHGVAVKKRRMDES